LGIIPGGGTQRLSRLAGPKVAKEMIFTGKSLNAKRAYELGIVNKVVSSTTLDEEVFKLVAHPKKCQRFALKQANKAIDKGLKHSE
jgi:enoyl-CoA hydratase/carnithine racemase